MVTRLMVEDRTQMGLHIMAAKLTRIDDTKDRRRHRVPLNRADHHVL